MNWISETVSRIASLSGCRIERASIVEMAVVESGPGGAPLFRHLSMPFIQAELIELELDDGRIAQFANYQNDDVFPISLTLRMTSSIGAEWDLPQDDGRPSIFRRAETGLIPCGPIMQAKAHLNAAGDISEVTLSVGEARLTLVAGEVVEEFGDKFAFVALAGAIALFQSDADRARLKSGESLSWR